VVNHSPEPWTFREEGFYDCDKNPILTLGRRLSWTDAERIVTCVNACRGIPEHALKQIIKEGILGMSEYEEYKFGGTPGWLLDAQEIHLGYKMT
jgi:hypothetical protein